MLSEAMQVKRLVNPSLPTATLPLFPRPLHCISATAAAAARAVAGS